MKEQTYRIDNATYLFMVIFALFVDGLEALLSMVGVGLVTGVVTTPVSWFILWMWFKVKGVSFGKNTRMIGWSGGLFIVGLFPILGSLPEFTAAVILNIRESRKEDQEKVIAQGARPRKRTTLDLRRRGVLARSRFRDRQAEPPRPKAPFVKTTPKKAA